MSSTSEAAIVDLIQRKKHQAPPIGLERMLRIHFLQLWFNLSDPGVEEALYESLSMRRFVGIDLGREPVPDETTVCKFRHLLERHDLGRRLFEQVHQHLELRGLTVATGTIVDATIINAPSSTISMDGRGRCQDNIFVERLWWTVKYEWVYLRPASNGFEQERSLGEFFEV